MTKTSKPRAITFPAIKGTNVRRNAETGIEITNDGADGYSVRTFHSDKGDLFVSGFRNLADARAYATEQALLMRDEIAEDYAEARRMDLVETARLIAAVVDIATAPALVERAAAHAASNVVTTLLSGAVHSAQAGFIQVATARLVRAHAILEGAEVAPSNEEAEAARVAANDRMPVGTLVRVKTGDRNLARIDGPAWIFREHGRVCVSLRYVTKREGGKYVKQGYGSAFLDDVEIV